MKSFLKSSKHSFKSRFEFLDAYIIFLFKARRQKVKKYIKIAVNESKLTGAMKIFQARHKMFEITSRCVRFAVVKIVFELLVKNS